MRIDALRVLVAACVLCICASASAQNKRVSVSRYREDFAKRYAEAHALNYRSNSASTTKRSDVTRLLSNLFQPRDSRFTSGYDRRLQVVKGKAILNVAVGLFLTGARDFAEYTQWKKLQIIPIRHVVDEDYGRAGYGVFKYLKRGSD